MADFGSARWIQSLEETQQVSSLSIGSLSSSVDGMKKNPYVSVQGQRGEERTPLLQADALMSSEVGTLAWAAPEVLGNSAYGAPADVFR